MSYSCSDFYAEVCAVAVQELGTAIPEHDGTELELDAESVVVSIQRAARERRELLSAARAVIASWADGDLAAAVNDLEAAIAKAESANSRAG